jgi:signal transduction histidine kinase
MTNMTKNIRAFFNKYFGNNLDFRAHIFNALGFFGIILGIGLALFSAITGAHIVLITGNLFASVFAAVIIFFANRTKKFQLFFLMVVVIIFIILFPILFFTGGGHKSGMPAFFVLAIVFTVLMLDRKFQMFFIVSEIVLYLSCLLIAFYIPESVIPFPTEKDAAIDIIFGSIAVCIVLSAAMSHHIVLYDRKQAELEKAIEQQHKLNNMKTEFLQDMSHEMKNPLTVIVRYIGYASTRLDKPDSVNVAKEALKIAEDEALRLGRMVSGMLQLSVMSGGSENRVKINFSEMLKSCAETFRLQVDNDENILKVNISPDLPDVYGHTDRLMQVLINLFSNASKHTKRGTVSLEAFPTSNFITVRLSDTGDGISPEIMPFVFDRGVSENKSTGFGLPICKTIIEAHGGDIFIESEPNKGTCVTFTIPVYGGQDETRDKN